MTKTVFTIKLIYDPVYKGYVAECVNLPGCMSQGKTKEKAFANIKKAIRLCMKVLEEDKGSGGKEVEIKNIEIPIKLGAFA